MYQVAVIGAGPIGIELAVALKRANVNYVQLEAGELANTIAHYPEQTPFFSSPNRISVADYPLEVYPNAKATKEQYLSYLRGIVKTEKLQISLHSKVVNIRRDERDASFELRVRKLSRAPNFGLSAEVQFEGSPEQILRAKNIVIAFGDLHSPNLINVPGEDLPHVSHGYDKPHSYFGLNVLIVGGKNSAVEAAERLARIGAKICLCHRNPELNSKRIKPWLLPDFNALVREGQITCIANAEVQEIRPTEVSVKINGDITTIPADKVLLLTGYRQSSELFSQLNLKEVIKKSGNTRIDYNPETMEAASGVFVIGTATAGTQVSDTTEYIETSHVHIPKVLKALQIECKISIQDLSVRPVEQREL